jgi:hypothetical protein
MHLTVIQIVVQIIEEVEDNLIVPSAVRTEETVKILVALPDLVLTSPAMHVEKLDILPRIAVLDLITQIEAKDLLIIITVIETIVKPDLYYQLMPRDLLITLNYEKIIRKNMTENTKMTMSMKLMPSLLLGLPLEKEEMITLHIILNLEKNRNYKLRHRLCHANQR